MGPIDHADLTARFNALREVIQRDIKASQDLADTRMDGQDTARAQHLATLAEQHAGLLSQIQSVRAIQDAYHAGVRTQLEERTQANSAALAAAAASLQLQLNQRFDAARESATLLQAELDRRFDTLLREGTALQQQVDQRTITIETAVRHAAESLQMQLDQRFKAEEEARKIALDTATAAVHAALAAAETAVNKAEEATEKRFDGVNEFRRTLADQTASFPTRIEISAQMEAVTATGARNADAIKDLELRLTSRLDTLGGRSAGQSDFRAEHRLDTAQIMQLLALLVVAAGVVISIVLKH